MRERGSRAEAIRYSPCSGTVAPMNVFSMQVLQRAAASGVEAFVAYTSDFEKAEALARLAKENTSVIYCMVR